MLDQIRRNIKIPNLGIKDKSKKVFDKIKNVMQTRRNDGRDNTRDNTTGETNAPPETETKKKKKKINYGTYEKTKDKFFNNKNNKNKKSNLTKAAEFGAGAGTFGAGPLVGTQLNKGKKGKLPKFTPKLPQTSHNIGRTSNPQ